MLDYIETAEYPEDMIPIVKKMNVGRYFYEEKYGGMPGASMWDRITIIMEMGRVDASLATAVLVQHALLGKTIEMFGSEEQKKELIPKIMNLEIIGGWGLTEKNIGSDASSMETRVKLEGDHYILNGNKRWIGNANKDVMCVFAKNE